MIKSAPNINHLWARIVIEELVRLGTTHFFVAPGSRSTPLVVAAGMHPAVSTTVHFDERGTAFAALGYGRATGQPAVWITTSGTAVANGLPAVVEAFADGVPLFVLTADRPPELRRTGANQTIEQPDIFEPYVRWRCDAPAPSEEIDAAFLLTTIDQAVHRARMTPGGPVHVNWMFREPLAPVETKSDWSEYLNRISGWIEGDRPYTSYAAVSSAVSRDVAASLYDKIRDVERGIIVAGRLETRQEGEAVLEIASALQWPALADIASQVRLGEHGAVRIAGCDYILDAFAPPADLEAVLYFGRRSTSKRLAGWIEAASSGVYAVIDDYPDRFDPSHKSTHRIEASPTAFSRAFLPLVEQKGKTATWLARWRSAARLVQEAIDVHFGESQRLHEPLTARLLSRLIPPSQGLFVASSMPVRDMDVFAVVDGSCIPVGVNRGASGIDGTIASAIGFSIGLDRPATVILGDLAFLHDLNSLAILRGSPHPLILVAVNNNGGGIFSFLPIAEFSEMFETYFGTPHHLDFRAAASLFDMHYESPANTAAFEAAYTQALTRSQSTLIEVRTDRKENVAIHAAVERRVAEALRKVFL